jgi:hypothetical protein
VSIKVIPNYVPPDKGWGIVVGRFVQPPEPKAEEPPGDDGEEQDES